MLRLCGSGDPEPQDLRRRSLYAPLQRGAGGHDRRAQGPSDHLRHLGAGDGGHPAGYQARRRGDHAVVHLCEHGQRLCPARREDCLCGCAARHHESGPGMRARRAHAPHARHRAGALRGRVLRHGRTERHRARARAGRGGGCGAGRGVLLQGPPSRLHVRRGLLQLPRDQELLHGRGRRGHSQRSSYGGARRDHPGERHRSQPLLSGSGG